MRVRVRETDRNRDRHRHREGTGMQTGHTHIERKTEGDPQAAGPPPLLPPTEREPCRETYTETPRKTKTYTGINRAKCM